MIIKPTKSIDEQINLLKARGLIINDYDKAKNILKNINYYRFSAYLLPYKSKNGRYTQGATFEEVYDFYEFNAKLNSALISILSTIEISFRTYVAYTIAMESSPIGYEKYELFENKEQHRFFLEQAKLQIEKNRSKIFIKHHFENYRGQIPIWVLVEILTFGQISKLYSNFKKQHKIFISSNMLKNNIRVDIVTSWIKKLSILRNECAHFGRIYGNNFNKVKILNKYKKYNVDNGSFFAHLLIIKELIYSDAEFESFVTQLNNIINDYSSLNTNSMGFPRDWLRILKNNKQN